MLVQQSCLLGLNNVVGLGVFSADVHSDDFLIPEDDVKQPFEVVQAYIPLIPVGYGAIVVEHILDYRGLKEWGKVNGYLSDTCLAAQDAYKSALDYFKIGY